MKKCLFVHGLGSDKDSTTGQYVKEILKDYDIEVITDTFDLLNPKKTEKQVKEYAAQVDMLIGHSLGGFYVLNETDSLPKIVINPCMFPSIEIPLLSKVEDNVSDIWKEMEDECYTTAFAEMRACTFGIFGKDDELFNYLDEFKATYVWKNNFVSGKGMHRLTYEQLENYLPIALEYFDNLGKPLKESPARTAQHLQEHYINIFSKRSEDKLDFMK